MNQNRIWRYLFVVVAFCLVSVIYLGRLFYIQISGRDATVAEQTVTKTVTVQAVRGEIYDRNGKILVSNRYNYDVVLSRSALMSLGNAGRNRVYLQLLDALRVCSAEGTHTESYFPFEGTYPNYSYSAAVRSGDSVEYYRLQRVLSDLSLKSNLSAEKLVVHYVDAYRLLEKDSEGERLYTDAEVDRLLRLLYDMDALRFRSNGEYVFSEKVDMSLIVYVMELGLPGVQIKVNVERVYHYPGYASHILGTVGPIYSEDWDYYNEQGYQMNSLVGKSGCEFAFESYLHGSDGEMRVVSDAAGNLIESKVIREPQAGQDVYLTIDIDLQIAAEDGLRENVEYVVDRATGITTGSQCNAGAAVVMDPTTFEVLVVASYPTYDLTTYSLEYSDLLADIENRPLLNRALNGVYAPGSTYKLGVSVAGLMENEITSREDLLCNGKYTRYSDYQPECWVYSSETSSIKRHGAIDVIRSIAVSCNCFFYELGYRLGIDRMNEYMQAFGFGEDTGLELGGATGVLAGPNYYKEINSPLRWTGGLTLQAAIGQSDNQASPMQLCSYMATLMNGGDRYPAHLLSGVYRFGDKETPSYRYEQTEDMRLSRLEIPEDVLDTVKAGMREMVESNAIVRRWMDPLPVEVGGKTGSAQNSSGCENALFVCAAPYDDPEIVISVVIEQGYTGSYAALTAARILECYFARQTAG